MEYTRFGSTGMKVSRICLGCMTYGVPERGTHPWTLNEEQSRPLLRKAVELGINFFDTANVYSDGTSEEIVGRALRDFAQRDEVVIATKVFAPWGTGPNLGGLSRKAIMTSIDASLRRLGTDYIDLYQMHRLDPETSIEETLEALHDVVKAGKARYIGASTMYAWQFAKALYIADLHGWTRPVSMQPHYNLAYREEEREMLPLCQDQRIGVIPWSPLARGLLTRRPTKGGAGTYYRTQTDEFGKNLYTRDDDFAVASAVTEVAEARGLPNAQVASRGCSPSLSSPLRSWVQANPITSTMPSGRCQSGCPMRKFAGSRSLTSHIRCLGFSEKEIVINEEVGHKT